MTTQKEWYQNVDWLRNISLESVYPAVMKKVEGLHPRLASQRINELYELAFRSFNGVNKEFNIDKVILEQLEEAKKKYFLEEIISGETKPEKLIKEAERR